MRSSNGEVRIFNVLRDSGLPFQEEYEFPDLVSKYGKHLRFDFCVFNQDGSILFLIEYQGKQHYIPIKRFGGEKGYHRRKATTDKYRTIDSNESIVCGTAIISSPFLIGKRAILHMNISCGPQDWRCKWLLQKAKMVRGSR